MLLRQWQSECIAKAISKYKSGKSHFLCLATPGAGKTVMASSLAKSLLTQDEIDLIICFSPSVIVANDFQSELECIIGKRFDGKLGSIGRSLTYQAMLSLREEFWQLFDEYRVFVIFDEIHHCAGNAPETSNAWGELILTKIQGKATHTLALTGTPWRSNASPIALANYQINNSIHCDYSYGLSKAIRDKVCRFPVITLIDNDQITVTKGEKSSQFNSLQEFTAKAKTSYQSFVTCNELITYVLQQANNRLSKLRRHNSRAGGLIVTSSIAHALQVHQILADQFGEQAYIATYAQDNAQGIIKRFKHNTEKWIISVGMISEGTNIPRLQVCCHLTRVKTELYFRQVLGRILRVDEGRENKGYLYMPAEPSLSEYAERLNEDIPNTCSIRCESFSLLDIEKPYSKVVKTMPINRDINLNEDYFAFNFDNPDIHSTALGQTYEAALDIFGRFNKRILPEFDL
ncbi:MAG: DEAD/DEAH box helicase [Neptuniibacter sp.]